MMAKIEIKLNKKDKFDELLNHYDFDPSIAYLVELMKVPEILIADTKRETEEFFR